MKVHELGGRLLAKVNQTVNWLYVLNINIAQLGCLSLQGEEEAWCWHARLGLYEPGSAASDGQGGVGKVIASNWLSRQAMRWVPCREVEAHAISCQSTVPHGAGGDL
jgi:hypothetical protein